MSAMVGKGSGRGNPRHAGAPRTTGARNYPNATPKKAPEGLIMLKANGENIMNWTNTIASYCEMKYGTIAGYIKNDQYPVRETLTAEKIEERFPGTTQAVANKMLVENMTTIMKQEQKDLESKFEMFAILESVVTEEGWNRVKSRNGFADALANKCPLRLIKLIKMEHSLKMNNVSDKEARYIAEDRYHRITMGPTRSLAEYYDMFDMCVSNMETLQCEGMPSEERMARHFLMRLDRDRYGGYMRDAINDDRNGTKALPDTRQKVVDAARMHIPSQHLRAQRSDRPSMPMVYNVEAKKAKFPCHKCKQLGHWARECPLKSTQPTDGTETNVASNTTSTETETKKVYHVDVDIGEHEYEDEDEDDYFLGAFGYHVDNTTTNKEMNKAQTKLHPREVALDCFANVNFIFNKELLSDVWTTVGSVKGFNGTKKFSEVGDLAGFGNAVYAPWAGVNGLAMCIVEDRYPVTYYQKVRIEVKINDDLVLNFNYKEKLGCYACMFDEYTVANLKEHEARDNYYCNVAVVAEREKEHTKAEVVAAKRARTMMRRMFYPADSALVRTINNGALVECDTTGKDVVMATDIYGKDTASMKGKAKDRKPDTYKSLVVPMMAQKEQTVYADVFHWRDVDFVLFIVKPLRLVMVQWIPKIDSSTIKEAVLNLCTKVEARGYFVTEIVVDPAKALAGLTGNIAKNVTVVGSRMHVADAEVEIRTVKERVRSSTCGLPYDTPRRLVRWQVYGAVMTYNMLLRPGQTVSSREQFTGVKSNYSRDVRAEFGEYVQAYVSPGEMKKNGPDERTIGAIALCSADNQRGTCWFMSLKTGKFFRADRWTPLPITDDVIKVLNHMYDIDEPKKSKVAARRRSMRMPVSQEDDREATREMLALPTERDRDVIQLPPATEMANWKDHIYTDTSDELQNMSQNIKKFEYEEALERTEEVQQTGLDELTEDNTLTAENETTSLGGQDNSEDKDDNNQDEGDDIELADPYDNFEDSLGTPDPQEKYQTNSKLGARIVGGSRRSYRIDNRRRAEARIFHAYRLTVRKALKQNERASKESIMKELRQLVDKNVWEIIEKSNLTKSQLKRVIRSSMFLTEKFTASGVFDKLKSRLVAGGDCQDKSLYDKLSSPTVAHETVMMVLAIAAIEKRKVATADITGAYLECDIADDDEVIMTIEPILAQLLSQIDPTVEQKRDDKGVIYVKLKKALYGCVQSAKLWYDKLCTILEADGYKKNHYDGCLFNKIVNGKQCTVAFHVDDLLITCQDMNAIEQLERTLQNSFSSITVNKSNKHSYLAMNINICDDGGIDIDMVAYIKKILEGRNIKKKPSAQPQMTCSIFQ